MLSETTTTTWINLIGFFTTTLILLILILIIINLNNNNRKQFFDCFRFRFWMNYYYNNNQQQPIICCWCCRKRKKNQQQNHYHKNKERINKELVNSFSYERSADSPIEEESSEDDLDLDDVGILDDVSNNVVVEQENGFQTINNGCVHQEDNLIRQQPISSSSSMMPPMLPSPPIPPQLSSTSSSILADNYYMTKLNECLHETNKWYQLKQQQEQQQQEEEEQEIQNRHHHHHQQHYNHHNQNFDPRLLRRTPTTGNNMDDIDDEREGLIRSKNKKYHQTLSTSMERSSRSSKLYGLQRQQSICLNDNDLNSMMMMMQQQQPSSMTNNNNDQQKLIRSRNILKQQAIYASFALKNNTKHFQQNQHQSADFVDDRKLNSINSNPIGNNDLISLAEKGRIGKQTSTDGSISSETTTNGSLDYDSSLVPVLHNHHHQHHHNHHHNNHHLNYQERKNLFKKLKSSGIGTTLLESSETNDDSKDLSSSIIDGPPLRHLIQNSNSTTTNKYQTLNNNYNYFDSNNILQQTTFDESDTQSSNLPDFSPNATIDDDERNILMTTTTTISSSIGANPTTAKILKNNNNNNGGGGNAGRIEISFAYDAPTKRLYVTVIQGDQLPLRDQQQKNLINAATSVCQIFIKILLLPQKKQKFRTKSKPIFCPVFDETFTFQRINPDEINNLGLRFKVFSQGFSKKTHLIGENFLMFSLMKPQQQETKLWFQLELPNKRNNRLSDLESSSLARTDSTSSQSLQNNFNSSPELLLGLSYNGTTGRLSVTIIKGSQFRSLSTRAPDTYVKLLLISQSGNEMARGKTRVCRAQPNPLFRETFVFQVALFQLPDVTLMIFVYNKRSIKRKEMIGWISLGYNSSGDEESSHWNDMRDNKGEQVSRWHVLNEPS